MDNHFQDISPYTKWKVGNNLWTFDRPTTKRIRPEIEENSYLHVPLQNLE